MIRRTLLPLCLLLFAAACASPSAVPPTTPPATAVPTLTPTESPLPVIPPLLFSSRRLDSNNDGVVQVPDGIHLYQLNPVDGEMTPLTNGPDYDTAPAPAPDGAAVAFVSTRGGDVGLWLLTMTDKSVQPLTPAELSARQPAWSPHGRYIAFSGGPLPTTDIYLLELASGEITPLSSGADQDSAPLWAADGRALWFLRTTAEEQQLVRYDMADTQTTTLPLPPAAGSWRSPQWLPGSDTIFELFDVGGAQPVAHHFSLKHNGSGWKLTPHPLQISGSSELRWLPDGRHVLAVHETENGSHISLHPIDPAGIAPQNLTNTPDSGQFLAADPFFESNLALLP